MTPEISYLKRNEPYFLHEILKIDLEKYRVQRKYYNIYEANIYGYLFFIL